MGSPVQCRSVISKSGIQNDFSGEGARFWVLCPQPLGLPCWVWEAFSRAPLKLYLAFCPVNYWVMPLQPVMTENDLMRLGLPKQEVQSLPVVAHHKEQVYSILNDPFLVLRTIYVYHDDQLLQQGRFQSKAFKPFQVNERVGTS